MYLSTRNKTFSFVALLFFLGIVTIAFHSWGIFASVLFLLGIFLIKGATRFVTSLFIAFLISLFLYQLTIVWIDHTNLSKEIKILLNRALLIILLFGLSLTNLFHKKKISFFTNKAKWNSPISLPFHSIKLLYFMGIGILISWIIFIPFILGQSHNDLSSILLFAILFSVINAIMEELIWRGIMLSSLTESCSIPYAIIVTSVGFGLLHLTVGIPFIPSLSFSLAGLIYGFVVLKANSIYPVILLHFFINIGMVLSGLIL